MNVSSFKPRLLGSSMLIAAAIALGATVPALADTSSITQGVSAQAGGGLTASTGALVLTPLTYSFAAQDSLGSMTVSAQDTRGTGAGWHVTQIASVFTQADTTTIPAANFALMTGFVAPARVAGEAVNVTAGNGPEDALIGNNSLEVSRQVLHAGVDYGQGSYSQDLPVDLTVPAGAHVGTYVSTLTTSIVTAP